MKIAIPVDNNSMESRVCISFGRTPFFLIFDTDTKDYIFLDNAAAASQGGAGIKAAQELADAGVLALITPRCGENAAAVLAPAGIEIYKTIDDSIDGTIKAFCEGKLPLLTEIHSGFHNHGKH